MPRWTTLAVSAKKCSETSIFSRFDHPRVQGGRSANNLTIFVNKLLYDLLAMYCSRYVDLTNGPPLRNEPKITTR